MNAIRLVALALFAASPVHSAENLSEVVRDLLSSGTVHMSILESGRHPRVREIEERLLANARANSDWWNSYVREHYDGNSYDLPYHENLGVSEEEYEFFQAGRDDVGLWEVGQVAFAIREQAGGYTITAQDSDEYGPFVIDLSPLRIETPYGPIEDCGMISRETPESQPLRWSGIACEMEDGNPYIDDAGLYQRFAIGIEESSGQLFMAFDALQSELGIVRARTDFVLRQRSEPASLRSQEGPTE